MDEIILTYFWLAGFHYALKNKQQLLIIGKKLFLTIGEHIVKFVEGG